MSYGRKPYGTGTYGHQARVAVTVHTLPTTNLYAVANVAVSGIVVVVTMPAASLVARATVTTGTFLISYALAGESTVAFDATSASEMDVPTEPVPATLAYRNARYARVTMPILTPLDDLGRPT